MWLIVARHRLSEKSRLNEGSHCPRQWSSKNPAHSAAQTRRRPSAAIDLVGRGPRRAAPAVTVQRRPRSGPGETEKRALCVGHAHASRQAIVAQLCNFDDDAAKGLIQPLTSVLLSRQSGAACRYRINAPSPKLPTMRSSGNALYPHPSSHSSSLPPASCLPLLSRLRSCAALDLRAYKFPPG